ncbi:MAG: NADH-quinone oxidoreductase subunit A [Acidobacteria bacterium]|nr:NADH-quinone oxidoreductase subunit A [Acidobacteriota bacterium]MBV9147108.1 NADH-quinone oxidoreductase subunit A [Acidobacteriota bacterium]MBV9437748.1 NADH-quinone oxidoreductase subunit A [Acidobacteriota bacterium]
MPNQPLSYYVNYLPLLMQVMVACVVAGGMVLLSALLGKHRYSRTKMMPYECGMVGTGDARQRFSVKFYMVAMLFILFDVEAIFLIPWAVVYRRLPAAIAPALGASSPHDFSARMFGFWEMLVYIGIVLVGFFYIWKKGVLDWNKAEKADL